MADLVAIPGGHRELPTNPEAEQSLLGALLANNNAYEAVAELLRPEHFADPVHAQIYVACAELIEAGRVANAVTLKNHFDASLEEVGGQSYLAQLQGSFISVLGVPDYARAIRDLYLRREVVRLAEDATATALANDYERSAQDEIDDLEARIFALSEDGVSRETGSRALSDVMSEHLQYVEAARKSPDGIMGLRTGITDLDRALGGLQASDLILLAARPSMGKTGLAVSLAMNIAKAGGSVLFQSLEMSATQISARMSAKVSGLGLTEILRGRLSDDEFSRVFEAGREVGAWPFHIDGAPNLSVPAIAARARRHKRRHGLDLLVIDHLGHVKSTLADQRANKVYLIEQITHDLKALAKRMNIPVLALHQLSRAVENREDKRPQLNDLRDSGALEQDADVVMFLYRPEYYSQREGVHQRSGEAEETFTARKNAALALETKWTGKAELIVAKQRQGQAPLSVELAFSAKTTAFTAFDRLHNEPPPQEPGW